MIKYSARICKTSHPPKTDPKKVIKMDKRISLRLISFFLIKNTVAMRVPLLPCSLLVAIATEGDIPTNNIIGIVIIPPPPAIVSIHPANTATKNSSISNSIVKSIQRIWGGLSYYNPNLPIVPPLFKLVN
ncbi:Uncharacterised protein [Streptococcus pneumoniae]|nr:Uncharacterised protein [Streptococcus pneumoniae]